MGAPRHEWTSETAPRTGRRGRKGIPNKITLAIKRDIMAAYKELGGVDFLVSMGQGEERERCELLRLIGKLLPNELKAELNGGVVEVILQTFIRDPLGNMVEIPATQRPSPQPLTIPGVIVNRGPET